jgi:membrane protease YdiL (CAAX protease family)
MFGLAPEDLRWKGSGPAWRGPLVAFVVGAVLIGLVMALGALAGARWTPDQGTMAAYLGRVGFILLMLAPAALAEEVVFRGLPLILLDRTVGRGVAIGLTALLFALAHSPNTGVTTLGIGNICVAGILLGVLLFAPGGIWTATGLHLGWNWALAALDAPVSGTDFKIPFIDYLPGQTTWLTGGQFGPEGGLMASAVLALATVVAAKKFLGHHHPVESTDTPG